MGASLSPSVVRFGAFELDLRAGELHKAGGRVRLQDKPFRVLAALVERPGELVTRQELCGRLWPADTFVDFDNSLNNAVNRVRAALGDAADRPRFVETVGRHGYRFIAPVEPVAPPATSDAAAAAAVPAVRRRAAIATVSLAALMVAAAGWQSWRAAHAGDAAIRSLAVLPFDNLSGNPEEDYLADGITDALITELAGIRSLRVISRQSVIRYKDSSRPLPEIARELGVDGIVEGAAVRSGSRVRVTAQLIDAAHDRHLWARSFEGTAGDVLAVQAAIARGVAEGVRATLTAGEQARFAQPAQVDAEAYDLYLRGRYFFNRRWVDDPETVLRKCVLYLEQAVRKDPRFALAHATLAFCFAPLGYSALVPPWEAAPPMERHAQEALALDPDLPEAHIALAHSRFHGLDTDGAEEEYRRAIDLNPGDAQARLWYSFLLLHLGEFDESRAQSARGLESDPFHPLLWSNHVAALVELGRREEALARARHMLEIEPATSQFAGWVYFRLGREQDALAEFEKARSEKGIARVRALRGDPSALRALLGRLHERARQRYVSPVEFAELHTALGETDAAFDRLEEAYRTKVPRILSLRTAWEFAPLRSDPRWRDLVQRLKLG